MRLETVQRDVLPDQDADTDAAHVEAVEESLSDSMRRQLETAKYGRRVD